MESDSINTTTIVYTESSKSYAGETKEPNLVGDFSEHRKTRNNS